MALFSHAFVFLLFYSTINMGYSTHNCLYYINQSQAIIFNQSTIEIEFDIELQHCNSICNIFDLTNSVQSISLSQDSTTSLILSTMNHNTTKSTESIQINREYHHLHLLFNLLYSTTETLLTVDKVYLYFSPLNLSLSTNEWYTFYLSASVSNLCLSSSTNTDESNISCGDTISNVLLSQTSTHSYKLKINDSYSVTIGHCLSSNEIIIKIYNTEDVLVSDSFCGSGNEHNLSLNMAKGIYYIDIRSDNVKTAGRYIWSVDCQSQNEEKVSDLSSALFLFLILAVIIVISLYYCKNQYMNAVIVNRTMVLIFGIARFDDAKWYLRGVYLNVQELVNLWKVKYGYDVFICKSKVLKKTRLDIENFIDEHKSKLKDGTYQCVIVHCISHGSSDGTTFMTSDGYLFKVEDIRRELSRAAPDPAGLIKIIFNHECRESEFNEIERRESQINTDEYGDFEDTNWANIWTNIRGHSVSELAHFTRWICDSFGKNITKRRKSTFNDLITEIGLNLEHATGGKYLSDMDETLTYRHIVLERCRDRSDANAIEYKAKKQMDEKRLVDDETSHVNDNDETRHVKKQFTITVSPVLIGTDDGIAGVDNDDADNDDADNDDADTYGDLSMMRALVEEVQREDGESSYRDQGSFTLTANQISATTLTAPSQTVLGHWASTKL